MGDSVPLNLSVGVFSGGWVQTGLPIFLGGDSNWPAYSQLMNATSEFFFGNPWNIVTKI
jgi:hypothetical protein